MKKYLIDNPTLKQEWDYEKNKNLDINTITSGMESEVWWKCSVCGNNWKSKIYSRFNGHGCPKCGQIKRANNRIKENINKVGSLASAYPNLLEEWDYEKNNELNLNPEKCTSTSKQKVWWKCKNNHKWLTSIYRRTIRKSNCPYCTNQRILKGYNDLATMNKILLSEWNYDKNIKNPYEIGINNTSKIWWKCSKCNYEWQATPASRNAGNGCPVCANKVIIKGYNDYKTINNNVMEFWDYDKNKIDPETISPGYNKKIYWKCPKCNHKWLGVTPRATREDTICPNCYSEFRISYSEKAVTYYIKRIDQTILENYKPPFLNGKEFDIYIPSKRIAIEYDGTYYHKDSKRDIAKDNTCDKNDIKIYRIREFGCPTLKSSSICINRIDDKNESLNLAIKELIKIIYNKELEVDVDKDNSHINELIIFNNKKSSLLDVHPELVKEWDYDKNNPLKPEYVKSSSSKNVWWKCSRCGNNWNAAIYSRSVGNGCPYCSNRIIKEGFNDLKTICPTLSKEWNYDKNESLVPENIGAGTAKKVWWKCSKCDFEWKAAVNSRVRGNGCPNCARIKSSNSKKYCKNNINNL